MKLTHVLRAAVVAAGLMGCGPVEDAAEQQPQVDETGEVHAAGSCFAGYFVCLSDGSEVAYGTILKGTGTWCGLPTREEARVLCQHLCGMPCILDAF